jgi:two-component system sensor histidine kinase KdpD
VTTTIPEHLPLLPLDGVLMEQVFFNLLENAVKYTPASSPIDISARQVGDSVEVYVADRGPGLEPGSEQRVFDKFYRRARAGIPGTGLGLAICRGIVTAHGATISAESRDGGGALFRLRLPLGEGAPALEGEPAESLSGEAAARDSP